MRDQFITAIALLSLFTAAGCGWNPFGDSSGTSDNKTITDKAVDTAVGESKIGVPECDEVMDAITKEMNNPEDDFVTKAVKATILNRIKDGIRDSVEKNKQDTAELAKTCREFKMQFAKYKAEEAQQKQPN